MHHAVTFLIGASGVPNFSPSFDWPGGDVVKKVLNAFLGLVALLMVLNIIRAAAMAAHATTSGRHGGGSGAGMGIALSLVVLVLIFTGAAFINDWVHYLSPS